MNAPALPRRHLLSLPLLAWTPLQAAPKRPAPLWACVQLRVALERLVKLELERRALPALPRAAQELGKELGRVEQLTTELSDHPGLSARRRAQVQRVLEGAEELLQSLGGSAELLLQRSEALAARLGFVSLALSDEADDPAQAQQLDLISRAGSTALRVGKLNFAARSQQRMDMAVPATQALGEFRAALDVIAQHPLPPRAAQELAQAQTQWLLFRATLGENGLVKAPERLPDVATTTDRIAQSLTQLAQRLVTA